MPHRYPHRLPVLCALATLAVSACKGRGEDDSTDDDSGPDVLILDIEEPDDGEEVFGLVRVEIEVRNASGASASFALFLDGEDEAARIAAFEDVAVSAGKAQVEFAWDSVAVANGAHTLYAEVDGGAASAEVGITVANVTRAEAIPWDAVKVTPATDQHPPQLTSAFASVFAPCAPMSGPINTAGAEDSPFITADGSEMYVFFTPDPTLPAEQQLSDRTTGIWRSAWTGSAWSEPERVWLFWHDEVGLDGCETVVGDTMWFCSVRTGYDLSMWTAVRTEGEWRAWAQVDPTLAAYEMGEMHIDAAGETIWFHSARAGGAGATDIWVTKKVSGSWQAPENVAAVNTADTEGWPHVTEDGTELWFTRANPAPTLWRSTWSGTDWQAPELVVQPLAGESTMDTAGNLYFVHHFWDDVQGSMIEADIYRCDRL